jgi:hypothetical protein
MPRQLGFAPRWRYVAWLRVEANHVASAREKGWSWQQIGDALGVTRQSVHTKYNKESS